MVLISVAQNHVPGRVMMESQVFPPKSATTATAAVVDDDNDDDNEDEKAVTEDELAPKDAPQGSFRYKLIKYMIDTNLTIKRLISEYLYYLCHENVDLFIERTGFGNAVGLLQGRGILSQINTNKYMNKNVK